MLIALSGEELKNAVSCVWRKTIPNTVALVLEKKHNYKFISKYIYVKLDLLLYSIFKKNTTPQIRL